MESDSLAQKLNRWRARLTQAAGPEAGRELEETFEELSATLEEAQTTEEELRQQNDELGAAREAVEKERHRYEELFQFAPDAYLVTDLNGTIQEANGVAGALIGTSARFLRGKPLLVYIHEEGRREFSYRMAGLRAADRPVEMEVVLQPRMGGPRQCAVSVVPVREPLGRPVALRWLVRDVTARKQAEEQIRELNADLEGRVAERTAALAALNERSAFLAEAGAVLDASLDYAATTGRVARLAVPMLGQWCLVDIVEGEELARAESQGEDPSGILPPDPGLASRVVQSGRPAVHTEAEFSALCVPMRAHNQVLGAITLISRNRQYTMDDLPFVEEFGRRAGMAIDNARLYDQTSRIAEMLQRSLLPDRLPRLEGVAVGARYFPAKQERVGGDWYDVMERPDGTIAVAVGDVSGKGLRAAVMMGKLRSALRAYALEGHSPSGVLERLDHMLRDFDESQMATVLYLTVDPKSWTVRFSSAGHVPPLLRTPHGTVTYLGDGRSVPLGVSDCPVFHEATHMVEPGSTLLLYTDGLIERQGGPLELGLTRLQAAVSEAPPDPDGLCDYVVASLLPDGSVADDVALISLFVAPALERPLELRLSAEPTELRVVRSTLVRWMREAKANTDETYDVVVAACEAVTNAIQHAYGPGPASILVRAALDNSGVVVTVRDWGRWYDNIAEGYGLRLMRGLMDAVDIDTQGEGTEIRMTRHLEGPQAP